MKTELARRRLTLSRVTVSVVAALYVIITASCHAPAENEGGSVSTETQKAGTGELRTDEEPLMKRFSVLEAPREVRWMSGTYGDSRNPGPSTYWIDAVITLDDDQIDELTTAYSPASTSQTPSVVDGMKEHLPPGPFQTSDALNTAFKEGRWWARAYLDPQSNKLVLVATGT
ncbi:MAG: hypothetical protein ACRDS9_19120 [Pseudonocardiaceae bacterium]